MDRITILFKSGVKVRVRVDDLTVTRSGDKITKMAWKKMEPRQLFIDVTEIASIFMGRV